jgi:hypothetical protein
MFNVSQYLGFLLPAASTIYAAILGMRIVTPQGVASPVVAGEQVPPAVVTLGTQHVR